MMVGQGADNTLRIVAPASNIAGIFAMNIAESEYARMEGLPLVHEDATNLTEIRVATSMQAPQLDYPRPAEVTPVNVFTVPQSITGLWVRASCCW